MSLLCWINNNILFLCAILLIHFATSCRKIITECYDENIDWLNGTFEMNPTLVADGRPVYIEWFADEQRQNDPTIAKRIIYHYSHEPTDNINYLQTDFNGKWILGNDMYSSGGWAYIDSWSISPTDTIMKSFVNKQEREEHIRWTVFVNQESQWNVLNPGTFSIECDDTDSASETIKDANDDEWLFVTSPNNYNVFTQNDSDYVTSITKQSLHGFYYKIKGDNVTCWRKVESKIFLCQTQSTDSGNSGWSSYLPGAGGSNDDYQYSFFVYNNYTYLDGTPKIGNDDIKINKSVSTQATKKEIAKNGLSALTNKEWKIRDDNGDDDGDVVSVVIITANDDADKTIYDAFRDYYAKIKRKSFDETMSKLDGMDAELKAMTIKEMNNGLPFLMLGLGTGGLNQDDAKLAQEIAINGIGYRLIDGAEEYQNEYVLGNILLAVNVERDAVFIQSKVWPTNLGFIQTYESVLQSLNHLKTNYIDAYLIHWNRCNPQFRWMDCSRASNRPWSQTWQLMEKLYGEGILLSIGVSNYDFETLQEMLNDQDSGSKRFQIKPQIIQNYFDIAHQDWDLVNYLNKEFGMIYQGYAHYRGIAQAESRQKSGETHYKIFEDKLMEICKEIGEYENEDPTPSQVILRWLIQKGIAVIPRSKDEGHLKDNWNIWDFDLTDEHVNDLTALANSLNRKVNQKTEL